MDVIRYVPKAVENAQSLLNFANDALLEHRRYITEHFDDVPRICDWVWSDEPLRTPDISLATGIPRSGLAYQAG
jgi:hypothetical protein